MAFIFTSLHLFVHSTLSWYQISQHHNHDLGERKMKITKASFYKSSSCSTLLWMSNEWWYHEFYDDDDVEDD